MTIWFSADHHFDHGKILEYCDRPFKSLNEMNWIMVKRWNEKVSEGDLVFYLGDFCFEGGSRKGFDFWRSQLKGDIIFIRGSHDRRKRSIIQSITLRTHGINIYLSHEPEFKEVLNLCGHVHHRWRYKIEGEKMIINVGVDVWDFYPVSLEEILDLGSEALLVSWKDRGR